MYMHIPVTIFTNVKFYNFTNVNVKFQFYIVLFFINIFTRTEPIREGKSERREGLKDNILGIRHTGDIAYF